MFWCNMQEAIAVLEQLNGNIFLIKGNHDRCGDGRFLKKFVKVTEYLEVEDAGRKVVLCHYPIPCFKNHYYGWYHLYGHVHSSFEYNMMEHNRYLMQELYGIPCHTYDLRNEVASPISLSDVEFLNDWWEGEKYIKLFGIKAVGELDISGGIYE